MWPEWQVRDRAGAAVWFHARLAFPDGARVDALAVAAGGRVLLEEVRAEPPLALDDLALLADWLEDPLFEACVVARSARPARFGGSGELREGGQVVSRHGRAAWPRGAEGRRMVAEEYRAAQERGTDPVLAVMCATGHSRRRSLRLIAGARDAGLLAPRHVRR